MSIDIAAIAARTTDGVVGVRGRRSRGTGVVIADGTIVTTAHNAHGDHLEVTFADGSTARAEVRGRWDEADIAVLAADTAAATPLDRASGGITIGTEVVAIGAPDGVARVTAGAVASTEGRFRTGVGTPVAHAIEHTAPLPRGSSGGPVLDVDGALVGLNINRAGSGFYQAVPTDQAFADLVERLGRGEVPTTRRLGVTVAPRRQARHLREAVGLPPADGVLVTGVDPDGPGGRAGLGRGDLIQAVDGAAVAHPDDLLLALRGAPEQVTLDVVRGAEDSRSVAVDFGGAEEGPAGDDGGS